MDVASWPVLLVLIQLDRYVKFDVITGIFMNVTFTISGHYVM